MKVPGETKNALWDKELPTRDVFFTFTPGTPPRACHLSGCFLWCERKEERRKEGCCGPNRRGKARQRWPSSCWPWDSPPAASPPRFPLLRRAGCAAVTACAIIIGCARAGGCGCGATTDIRAPPDTGYESLAVWHADTCQWSPQTMPERRLHQMNRHPRSRACETCTWRIQWGDPLPALPALFAAVCTILTILNSLFPLPIAFPPPRRFTYTLRRSTGCHQRQHLCLGNISHFLCPGR